MLFQLQYKLGFLASGCQLLAMVINKKTWTTYAELGELLFEAILLLVINTFI